jgi:hypothetical protein
MAATVKLMPEGRMIGTRAAMAMLCTLGLGLAGMALAQSGVQWRGGAGWGRGGAYNRLYDPKTVETVSGKVVRIERITPMAGMGQGVHLVLETDGGTIPVHLGPAWYVERQDTTVAPNDHVEVKGSRVTFDAKPAIIAAQVRKGERTLVLRDDAGIPVWAGWRRR